MPMKFERWNSFSPTNASQVEVKLGYSNSTSQHHARLGVLSRSTQERGFASVFHLSMPSSLSVRDATIPAMSANI